MALPVDSTSLHESSQNVDDLNSTQTTQQSSPSPVGSDKNTLNSTSNQPSLPSSSQPSSQAVNNAPTLAAPHPKRFSAVNINKKFLSKEPPATGPSATASNLVATKSNGPSSRSPAQQATTSRSRLFTTKLTATPSIPPPNGASWSRPSSTSSNPPPSNPAQNTDKSSNPISPFAPQNGKVIQPQPRSNSATKERQSNSSPVWGNRKNTQNVGPNLASSADFPTAAEAVQEVTAKKLKPSTTQEAPSEPSASQQARMDEADTFRGVHLDPNAHHWDEMEEDDDDNFLSGVVEFGDGKQYKIAPASTPPTPPPQEMTDDRPPTPGNDEPVSKAERFGNDIGRHWPHGAPTATFQRHPSASPASTSVSLQSPQDVNRHLFNERSNRLEPYGNHQQRTSPFAQRKELYSDSDGHPGQKSAPFMRQEGGSRFSTPPTHRDQGRRPSRHIDGPANERGRRLSNMGPPPSPFQHSPTDSIRQMPPHLSPQMTPVRERERRMSSRDSHRSRDSMITSSPQLGREDLWLNTRRTNQITSPALSFTSTLPATVESPIASLPADVDLDEVRKGVMHTAAERAKQRRQQEEEEREAQRERARKKAAELEAKFGLGSKAASQKEKDAPSIPAAIDDQVNDIIAEAIASVEPSKAPAPPSPSISTSRRVPSFRGTPRRVSGTNSPQPLTSPRASTFSESKPGEPLNSADKVDSWRRSAPLHPPPAPIPVSLPELAKPSVPSPPAFPSSVFILEEKPGEELEVVDFAELGRFMGVVEPEPPVDVAANEEVFEEKPASWSRPVASDFFDDRPAKPETSKPSNDSWRKPAEPATLDHSRPHDHSPHHTRSPPIQSSNGPTSHVPLHSRIQRPANSYKEAKLSTLDDTMSRIRGALHNMHEPGVAQKTAPSHLEQPARFRSLHDTFFDEEQREIFDVSASEPPRSPPPAWRTFVVSLGKHHEPVEPVNKRQLANCERSYPLRWDIMSFDPPVEGMSGRDLSLNDVLFRKQTTLKGKFKYRVFLPRDRPMAARRIGPRVNLPSTGSFKQSKDALESPSWRKQGVPPIEPSAEVETTVELATTSCSPPPDSQEPAPLQKTTIPSSSTSVPSAPVMGPHPQMGSGAANESAQVPKVNGGLIASKPAATVHHGTLLNDKSQPTSPFSATSGKVESTSSDESTDRPITPPQRHTTTWAKSPLAFTTIESPVAGQQGPDAEHIKAVWLQTPEKPHAPVSNSLEGIGDDLTALPFTIQEVKSEDGETPPPTLPASRMSFDMKRAFQQVPAGEPSTNATSSRAPQPVPVPPGPHPRYPSYGYQMPPPSSSPNARPAYGAYGPVMPPPSPAMYPHPGQIPMRMPMNGQPHYGQPIWMVQGPPMASPGGVIRPLPSPYSVPMMPFTPGTPVYAMPPPNMQNGQMPMNGTMAGRGIPPSPIMPQQNGTPAPYAPAPPQRQPSGGYNSTPVPPGRGQRSTSTQSFHSNGGFMNNNTWRN